MWSPTARPRARKCKAVCANYVMRALSATMNSTAESGLGALGCPQHLLTCWNVPAGSGIWRAIWRAAPFGCLQRCAQRSASCGFEDSCTAGLANLQRYHSHCNYDLLPLDLPMADLFELLLALQQVSVCVPAPPTYTAVDPTRGPSCVLSALPNEECSK